MSEPKFPTQEAYFAWCAGVCQKIKTNSIAMNDDGIRKAVHEIIDMLYTTDHQELAGPSTIATLTAEKDKLKAHRDRYAAKCDRLTAELEALRQTR